METTVIDHEIAMICDALGDRDVRSGENISPASILNPIRSDGRNSPQ